jgi:hypothetical protein
MQEEYRKLIEELGFIEKEVIHINSRQDNFVIHGEIDGKDILFKAVSESDQKKVRGFTKEDYVEKLFQKTETDSEAFNFVRTKAIRTGHKYGLFYILRSFDEGKSLCDYSNLQKTTLFGYDVVLMEYEQNYKEILADLKKYLESLKLVGINQTVIPTNYLNQRFSEELSHENLRQISKQTGSDLMQMVDFYESNLLAYSDKVNTIACLGDLVPPNFIIDPKGRSIMTDFEWFAFDNYMNDPVFLWLFLHQYPKWQTEIIQLFVKTESDKLNFRMALIREVVNCTWHYRFADFYDTNKRPFLWYGYALAAGESWEKLLEEK